MNWMIIVGILFLIGGAGNITINIGAFFFGIAVGAVLIFLGLRKNGLLDKLAKKPTESTADNPAERELKVEEYVVSGTQHYLDNIDKLARTNSDWNLDSAQTISSGKETKRIYRYNYRNKPVTLVPEPENPHDRNAIMVLVADEKVGYISRDDNARVNGILKNNEVKYISGFIGGGQYKVLLSDGSTEHLESNIFVNVRIGYV